jgi:4'-phosphopantetheinyl transferase
MTAADVELWTADLSEALPLLAVVAGCLSPEERERASRFRTARDRDHFAAGRAFLRLLLARRLGTDAGRLDLHSGPHGKPELHAGPLSFNLSHAGDVAVCVIGREGVDVGVDIEQVRPMPDRAGAARMILSAGELEQLAALPEADQLRRFYEIWTCKEAVLKAIGTGLDRPLDSFVVAFPADEQPLVVSTRAEGKVAERFWLRSFAQPAGYIGAIASSEPIGRLDQRLWTWG